VPTPDDFWGSAEQLHGLTLIADVQVAATGSLGAFDLPAPAPTATPSPTTCSSKQPHNEKQQYRTDGCVDDCTDQSGTQMDIKPRQQPIPNKRADYSEKEVAKDSESGPPNDVTGQPAGNDTHEQNDQKALIRQMHWSPPHFVRARRLADFFKARPRRTRAGAC
jgi:hypothetical protein